MMPVSFDNHDFDSVTVFPNRKRHKPRSFRDNHGRLRTRRLIQKEARFRKSIEEPADSRNSKITLGKVETFRWLTVPPTWNTKPSSTDIKTVNWNGMPSKLVRTWDFIHPGPPYPEGDDFTKVTLHYPLFQVKGVGRYDSTPVAGNDKYRYTGGFTPSSFASDFLSTSDMLNDSKWAPSTGAFIDEATLASLGTSAFLRSVPKVEYANLAEFIGDVSDVPEQFKKTAEGFAKIAESIRRPNSKFFPTQQMPKEIADHFINHQFGWVPFVSDLADFINLSENLADRIKKAYDQNNQWIRVRRRLTEDESVSVITRGYTANVNPSLGFIGETMMNSMVKNGNVCKAYYELQHIETSHAWSVGMFKIYRPEFDASNTQHEELRLIRQLITLYGARIDPSVLWELTPWSWLIDYFTNIGDLIKTLVRTQFDAAAAKSFFLMKTSQSTFNFFQELNWNTGLMALEWPRMMEVKLRRKAESPYHFRSTVDLSAMQLAILAALGFSRGKVASSG